MIKSDERENTKRRKGVVAGPCGMARAGAETIVSDATVDPKTVGQFVWVMGGSRSSNGICMW